MISHPFPHFCALAAQTKMFEDRHEEFMSYFQIYSMCGSMNLCKKLLENPYPMKTFEDMDAMTVRECYHEFNLAKKIK